MFNYVKRLQYPINIKHSNPKAASIIISQYGGPNGELGASLRYLSQRYSMPYPELKGLLTDIGAEYTQVYFYCELYVSISFVPARIFHCHFLGISFR